MHPSFIEIDLNQFKKNISIMQKAIKPVKLCLPVKANAYGHGLCEIASVAEKMGIDYLAVAHLQEALLLRDANIKIPILVLGAIHEDQIPYLLEHDLEFTISSAFKARLVAEKCRILKKRCRVHIEVDTGMRRTGMRCDTAESLFVELKNNPHFDVVGIYSHLATGEGNGDVVAREQIQAFALFMQSKVFLNQPLLFHLANSSGTIFFKDAHFDMVLAAMSVFGYLPKNAPSEFFGIAPCFSLKARVAYFKVVNASEGISYGHSFIASKKTRVVTIPVGYGDGYRRALSNIGSVLIRGKKYPIVGTICMDQFMVDVGDDSVFVGDEVVLIGRQGDLEISVKEIASLCNTIPYEILCLFNNRIPRIYLNS